MSYYGGLCQVWNYQPVEKGSQFFDFVSMYVSILSHELFPISQGFEYMIKQDIHSADYLQDITLYVLNSFEFD